MGGDHSVVDLGGWTLVTISHWRSLFGGQPEIRFTLCAVLDRVSYGALCIAPAAFAPRTPSASHRAGTLCGRRATGAKAKLAWTKKERGVWVLGFETRDIGCGSDGPFAERICVISHEDRPSVETL